MAFLQPKKIPLSKIKIDEKHFTIISYAITYDELLIRAEFSSLKIRGMRNMDIECLKTLYEL